MHRHHISFKHALDGLITAVKTQPNFRVHGVLSTIALLYGLVFHLAAYEWLIILLTIAIGLAIELINTSIEFTVDLLTQEYRLLAKYAKDTAAAAMLVYAFFALLIALVIYVPKFLAAFKWLFI